MSKGGQPKDVFDVERIRQIIKLMEQHDLSEVDLQQGEEKIKLNRGAACGRRATGLSRRSCRASCPPPRQRLPMPRRPPARLRSTPRWWELSIPVPIRSRNRLSKLATSIHEESIVCIVEAMKVFSEIPAECSGKIVEILVNDQEPVDFGKPMFRVQPTK